VPVGDLRLDGKGRLWYATGEANTSATSFVGAGVFVLNDPRHGQFSAAGRVGGTELESTTIRALRFGGDKVWAATSRGVWSHSTTNLSGAWKLEFAPNPDYLPGGSLAADPNAPYKNIANAVAIDPKDPSKVILAVGWRSGDEYNGFYTKQGGTWQRITLAGAIASDPDNVGAVTFATSADGSKYYAIEQSPEQLATNPDSGLQGIYLPTTTTMQFKAGFYGLRLYTATPHGGPEDTLPGHRLSATLSGAASDDARAAPTRRPGWRRCRSVPGHDPWRSGPLCTARRCGCSAVRCWWSRTACGTGR
jgi:hypothetical protein